MDHSLSVLKEAHRLYSLNCAVHWLKPNSKAPVKAGWSNGKRDDWQTLERDYREGFGLGVRLGKPSKIGSGFLANIDVDIKSQDPKHRKEAITAFKNLFPNLLGNAPVVKTGNGFRVFVKTSTPISSHKLVSSTEIVKVYLPTTPINPHQQKALSKDELDKGFRVRRAWEIEFMSEGRQVVVPPSIHPETSKLYKWIGPFNELNDPPLIELVETKEKSQTKEEPWNGDDFSQTTIDMQALNIPEETKNLIIDGSGLDNWGGDRSAALFSACLTMIRCGLDDNQILNILTHRDYYLGRIAYEHRNTKDPKKAADWVKKYALKKARREADVSRVFSSEVTETPLLAGKDAVEAQFKALVTDFASTDWKTQLDRVVKTQAIKSTLKNIVLILENAISDKPLFKRNEFSFRDYYNISAPWDGAKAGKSLTDDDCIQIKLWIAKKFHVEPPVSLIFEAVTVIAMKNGFHPVRDYLVKLPIWDAKPRLDTWLKKYFGASGPDDYLAQVFRKWLVASVTRVFEPGAKFDWMPLLEGPQETGKSSFGEILFGGEYFTDRLENLADKDAALGLQGILCVEFAELDSLRRNELETVKGFVTRRVDKVRPPYGRRTLEIARQCVFFGTTNNSQYLIDRTGNRRFNPVEVGRLNFKALFRDRDQLWAEAMFLYQNGLEPSLYLEGVAKAQAEIIRRDKLVTDESDIMADMICECFENQKQNLDLEKKVDFEKFQIEQLFKFPGPFHNEYKLISHNSRWAAKAMRELSRRGFKVKNWKSNGRKVWTLREK